MRRVGFLALAIVPEVLAYPVVLCIGAFFSGFVFDIFEFLSGDVKWLWGAVVVPIGLAALSITRLDDLLSPKGRRSVLLDWPDYRLLKDLALAIVVLYCFGELVAAFGFYIIAVVKRPAGIIVLAAALVQVIVTYLTLVFAHWKSREILGE